MQTHPYFMIISSFIKDYLQKQQDTIEKLPHSKIKDLVELYQKAWREDRQIFACGNGGSASNASHFITDLSKGASDVLKKRFRGMSLNDNVSWMTALGNDYAYEDIYVRQLMNFAQKGDIFMVLSVSGNSPNVVKAVKWAKENGVYTVALVGGKKGQLADLSDFTIVVDDAHYGRAEDAQMMICHIICYYFIEIENAV